MTVVLIWFQLSCVCELFHFWYIITTLGAWRSWGRLLKLTRQSSEIPELSTLLIFFISAVSDLFKNTENTSIITIFINKHPFWNGCQMLYFATRKMWFLSLSFYTLIVKRAFGQNTSRCQIFSTKKNYFLGKDKWGGYLWTWQQWWWVSLFRMVSKEKEEVWWCLGLVDKSCFDMLPRVAK